MPKPHRAVPQSPAPEIESQIELESPASAPIAPQGRSSGANSAGGGDATAWMLLGLLALAGGVALMALPSLSWSAAKVASRLGELGVESGVVMLGGALMMVLGLVRRGQHAARVEMQYDASLLFEQIAAELVEIRSSLESTRAREESSVRQIEELRQELTQTRGALSEAIERNAPRDNSDAVFQLAAGLDKLGLRVEQRLRLHHSALQDSVEELSATVEHSRRSLEELLQTHSQPLPESALVQESYAEQPAAEYVAEAPVEEYSAPEVEAPQDMAPPSSSLGLLDQFEDVAAPLPAASHEHVSHSDEFDMGGAQTQADLERAARSSRVDSTWDEQLMVESQQDLDTKTKLLQLESLLGDERLRAALEAMRRQG